MAETQQKYELLALFPLIGTEEELQAQTAKVKERIAAAAGAVYASTPLQKGRLSYPVRHVRQGYYHYIQFEMDPGAVAQLRQDLLLSGTALRLAISKVEGEFKAFVPSSPRAARGPRVPLAKAQPVQPVIVAAPSPLAQGALKPEEVPKVTMEEIDKRLEKILGGNESR